MRIIIVDHDVAIGNMLAEAVRLQSHEAIVAGTTQEALSLLDQRPFDAVFLEIAMPEGRGVDFLRRIRQTHPALPVIVITGESTSPEVNEARRLGVIDVIEKPFALRNLNQALDSLHLANLKGSLDEIMQVVLVFATLPAMARALVRLALIEDEQFTEAVQRKGEDIKMRREVEKTSGPEWQALEEAEARLRRGDDPMEVFRELSERLRRFRQQGGA